MDLGQVIGNVYYSYIFYNEYNCNSFREIEKILERLRLQKNPTPSTISMQGTQMQKEKPGECNVYYMNHVFLLNAYLFEALSLWVVKAQHKSSNNKSSVNIPTKTFLKAQFISYQTTAQKNLIGLQQLANKYDPISLVQFYLPCSLSVRRDKSRPFITERVLSPNSDLLSQSD